MQLRQGLYAQLIAWAKNGYPYEVVALLLGHVGPAGQVCVDQIFPVANLAPDQATQFEMDPHGWLEADAHAQMHDVAVIGMIHTHPDGVPQPSAADCLSADALGSQFVYAIAAVDNRGGVTLAAWRWDGLQFHAQRLTWD